MGLDFSETQREIDSSGQNLEIKSRHNVEFHINLWSQVVAVVSIMTKPALRWRNGMRCVSSVRVLEVVF